MAWRPTFLGLLAAGWLGACAGGPAPGGDMPTLAPMVARVRPAMVDIVVRGHLPDEDAELLRDPRIRRLLGLPDEPDPDEFAVRVAGAGVVFDAARGLVLTSRHVVEGAEAITVVLDGGAPVAGRVLGADAAADVAVIGVPAGGLTAAAIGTSDSLRAGDYVVAFGNPFGLGTTVTLGVVGGIGGGEDEDGDGGTGPLIRTDAATAPGSSGGALVNLRGEVVGINRAVVRARGFGTTMGLAMPIEAALRAAVRALDAPPPAR
ncbi:S1C family serine protease [Azospirillum sp. ST 5-10]|uniref:S1C family serine protease n=1 Tax=unclassified Azospirillum TaxID=2630922 RepID=UPI003F4A5A20